MNIIRGHRREKLYRDWVKYANLPEEKGPRSEPIKSPHVLRSCLSINRDKLFYITLGAALFFMAVSIGLLIVVLLR